MMQSTDLNKIPSKFLFYKLVYLKAVYHPDDLYLQDFNERNLENLPQGSADIYPDYMIHTDTNDKMNNTSNKRSNDLSNKKSDDKCTNRGNIVVSDYVYAPTLFKSYHDGDSSSPLVHQGVASLSYANENNSYSPILAQPSISLDPAFPIEKAIDFSSYNHSSSAPSSRVDPPKRKLSVNNGHTKSISPAIPVKSKANKLLPKPKPIRQSSFPIAGSQVTRAIPNIQKSVSSSPNLENALSPDDFSKFFDFSSTNFPEYNSTLNTNTNNTHSVLRNNINENLTNSSKSVSSSPIPIKLENSLPSQLVESKKKSKNPGFHIPLDNLNNQNIMMPRFSHLMTSTNADSSTDKQLDNYEDLKILEPDLNYHEQNDISAYSSSIITPLMNPPGANTYGYFEPHSNASMAKDKSPNDSLQNYQNNLRHDDKELEVYLFNNSNSEFQFNNQHNFQNNASNDEFHPDLSGFNFDVNPKSDISSQEIFNPISFAPIDSKSLNTNSSSEEPEKELTEADPSKIPYLNISRPNIERTNSNQSTNSLNSINSNSKEKPKKKRTPKGAVCSVCDKYISRDLTRHMRIHNEIGRFQCVYPKFMCNHRTQYFNRPYDYKKHLLHTHFKFDDPKGKAANTLTDKLPLTGSCQACGVRFIANDWLESHALTTDPVKKCSFIENR